MRSVLLFICLITIVITFNSVTHQKIDRLYQKKGWASTLLKMAELHMLNKGPVDDLLVAMDDVTTDLNTKVEKTNQDYIVRTDEHNNEVQRINSAILKAKNDVQGAQDDLQNVLVPLVNHLKSEIVKDQQLIVDTKKEVQKRITGRGEEHEEYTQKMVALQEAIDTFQEVIDTLEQLMGGELVQVKAAVIFKKAHSKLSKFKNVDLTLAKSLAQIATSQDFTDQSALRKVKNLITDSQSNLKQSQGNITLEEKESQANFEQFLNDSKASINGASTRITNNTSLLNQTLANIEDTQNYIKTRQFDQANFENDLQEENDSFDVATTSFNELIAQLESEIEGVDHARTIITSGSFAGYISDRVNNQGTQPFKQQGSGVEVFQGYKDLASSAF